MMNLELIIDKLEKEKEFKYYLDISKHKDNLYMTRNQISEVLEYKNVNGLHKVIQRNKEIIGLPKIEKVLSNDGKWYNTKLYSIEQIIQIISYTNRPLCQILINKLSEMKGFIPIQIKNRYELDFEKLLFSTFKSLFNIEKQFPVQQYRLDFYVPKYNIIIECDENNHQYYCDFHEDNRTKIINNVLNNPIWIRFNPNDDDFNIGDILNLIIKKIFK